MLDLAQRSKMRASPSGSKREDSREHSGGGGVTAALGARGQRARFPLWAICRLDASCSLSKHLPRKDNSVSC